MKKFSLFPLPAVLPVMMSLGCAGDYDSGPTTIADKRPNIVLFISDDHGMDALGFYGNPVIKTPHLDELALDGTFFARTYATTSSCSPSRSVILSGLHNHANGMYGLSHRPHNFRSFDDVSSLPVLLSENGYRTGRIGKFHVAPDEVYRFDEALSVGTANDPASIGRSPVEMADLSAEFIRRDPSQPFFLLFGTDDPHRSNLFRPDGEITFESFPEPNPFGNQDQGYPGITERIYDPDSVMVPDYLPDNYHTRAELAQYYQSTSRMDQGIGQLVEILKKSGLYENTLFIYVSDNGPAFPASKTTLYEPGIHLPFVVKGPHQARGGIVQEGMVSLADFMPTILDYANIPFTDLDLHGKSFRTLVEDEHARIRDAVFGSHTMHDINMFYPMRMIRTEDYKLIHNMAHQMPFQLALDLIQSPTWISVEDSPYFGPRKKKDLIYRPRYELYHLTQDPLELINLADNPQYRSVLQSLKSELSDFQVRTRDPRLRLPVLE